MQALADYLSMGGYADFVWPAFGVTAAVMIGLVLVSVRRLHAEERALEGLEATRPARRRRS
jgi:heme exporter protein D